MKTKDYEVWDYILHHYYELVFSPAIETESRQTAENPKRKLQDAGKHFENTGIGTIFQQAKKKEKRRGH